MSASASPAPKSVKMLLDCDPGHDDAVAILYAARHFDLKAVTTVHGNNTLENTTRNALRVLELAGLDIPVAAGADKPLVQTGNRIAGFHGATGLDGADIPAARSKPVDAHAVDVIVETARAYRGELIVGIVGPQTNVALALAREPRLKTWIREFAVMGGSTTLGNVTSAAEFNIHCDPEAAAMVFGSGVPVRMAGYNMTRDTGFDRADIARLKSSGKRTATAIAGLMAFYLDRQEEAYGLSIAPMHDVCAMVPYVDPGLIEYLHTSVAVELAGTHTRGMTLCDMRSVKKNAPADLATRKAPNAYVALSSKARPLIDGVIETLLSYP